MKADKEYVSEAKRGELAAFSVLVRRHQQAMLRVVLQMTRDLEMAEDVVQDAFIKAFNKLETFEGRCSFKSWLYQITVNTARNKLRGQRKDTVDIENTCLSTRASAESGMMYEDLRQLLREEVDLLPDKQRLALNLRIYEDLSFKDIAEVMDCPYNTAKANFRHGLMRLRHRLQERMSFQTFEDIDSIFRAPLMEVK